MSNYIVQNYGGTPGNNKNLTEIFQPIGSTTPANATNYKQNSLDLNTIFAKFVSGNKAAATNYVVKGYSGNSGLDTDLKDIFQHDPLITKLWLPLNSREDQGLNNTVYAISINNSIVYAGGIFTASGITAINYLTKYTTTTLGQGLFETVGSGINNNALTIDVVRSSEIYIGGNFTSPSNYITKWNNDTNTYSALGSSSAVNDRVYGIAHGGNYIYVVGQFLNVNSIAGTQHVAKWDKTTSLWSAVGDGGLNSGTDGYVSAVAVYGSNVYIGGYFTTVGLTNGYSNIALWNGSAWSNLSGGTGNQTIDEVFSIAIDSTGNVYVGGNFISIGGVTVNNIAMWNGSVWAALGTGTSRTTDEIKAIGIDSTGKVCVGGIFISIGGVSTKNIAMWSPGSPGSWSALGSGIGDNLGSDVVNAIAIDSNDNIYAGGNFTIAGGVIASNIAVYGTPVFTTTGSVIRSSDINFNTILTWSSDGSITFYKTLSQPISYTLIGGGAGGSRGSNSNSGAGGAGGGNGQTINSSWTSTITTYTITLASIVSNEQPGMSSSISGVNTAAGGVVGGGGVGGAGGGGAGGSSANGGGGGGGGLDGTPGSSGGTGGNGGGNGGNGGTATASGIGGNNGSIGGGGGGGGGQGGVRNGYGGGGEGGPGSLILKFIV